MDPKSIQRFEITGVELMAADTPANGVTFSEADLQGIAAAHRLTGSDGRVPLRLGHSDDSPLKDGAPALGWCRDLHVANGKLLGTFTDLPKFLFDLIKLGNYKFLSVELARNATAGTRVIPWMLTAVAVLGSTAPAFGSLRDLQSLATMSQVPRLPCEAHVTFALARTVDPTEELRRQNDALQAQLRAAAFESATQLAIVTHRVTPADVARFTGLVAPEGRTVAAWMLYSKGITPPKLGPSQRAADSVGGDSGTQHADAGPDDTMVRLTREYIDEMDKRGKVVTYEEAARVVMHRDPEATRAWLDMPNGS